MNSRENDSSANSQFDLALSELIFQAEQAPIPARLRKLAERLDMALRKNHDSERKLK